MNDNIKDSESVKFDDTSLQEEVQKYFTSKRFNEDLFHYRDLMSMIQTDVPLSALCLPTKLENLLSKQGFRRVNDFRGINLAEIEGLGDTWRHLLCARLDEFFTVGI